MKSRKPWFSRGSNYKGTANLEEGKEFIRNSYAAPKWNVHFSLSRAAFTGLLISLVYVTLLVAACLAQSAEWKVVTSFIISGIVAGFIYGFVGERWIMGQVYERSVMIILGLIALVAANSITGLLGMPRPF